MSLPVRPPRWRAGDPVPDDALAAVTAGIDIPPVVGRLLVRRGITTPQAAKDFFNCRVTGLHDPSLMRDMDRAVGRLRSALDSGERIAVYGDYDVDGITSVSLLYTVLKHELNADVVYYVPNRLEEGYGLSCAGIDELAGKGAKLIITVDCGITALPEVAHAAAAGIDVIVTDHHEPGDELPAAAAVLDPKRHDETYPYRTLAGVGVAFKLLQGLYAAQELPLEGLLPHLDLVALGTVADIVPLKDENRVLVRNGIDRMEKTGKAGLRALLSQLGLTGGKLNSGRIVFGLAPRLNAGGRLGDAARGIRLLTTGDAAEADRLVSELEVENSKRRDIDRETFEEADAMLAELPDAGDARCIVLASDTWHAGVIGIVASRLVEKYHVPTVLITFADGDVGRGSARSIPAFDMYDALKECRAHLEGFGGHTFAAGMSVRRDRFDAFAAAFARVAADRLTEDDLVPEIRVEEELDLADLNPRFMRIMHFFGPFGPGNMRPVFHTNGIRAATPPRIVGANHLKLRVKKGRQSVDAIGFGMADRIDGLLGPDARADIVFTPEENVWQGKVSIQLRLKDIRFPDE